MRKIILTSAILLTTALGASTFALADKAPKGDRGERMTKMCSDITAREAGHLSYLEAKLKPTSAQTKAWDNYKNVMTAQATAKEKSCLDRAASMKERGKDKQRPTIIERQDMMEKGLEAKLASLKATKPATAELYAALNDGQKKVMDRQGRKGHGEHGKRHGKFRDGMKHKAHFERQQEKPADTTEQ